MATAMVRRTPKPFTVELRKSGRHVKAAVASWPADPMIAEEQPRVSWPGLDDAPELTSKVQEPVVTSEPITGRVLPALDELKLPMEVAEPERRSRAHGRVKPAAKEDQAPKAEGPTPTEAVFSTIKPDLDGVAAEEPDEVILIASDIKDVASTLLLRHGRKRLLRSELKRGERWKARLPIAAVKRDRQNASRPDENARSMSRGRVSG